jgi:short-chain fatty acids transporter
VIRTLGRHLARLFRAITPDPFVLAILLTTVTGIVAVSLGRQPFGVLVESWHSSLWNLLGFAMQMCLVLVTGHALASAPLVRRGIARLVELPRSAGAAAALVAFVSIAASLLNWGLGLIVGALLARDMGRALSRRSIRAHYPLLAAAGYTGLMTWHGGFSGSAPLKVTSARDLVELLGPELGATITPVSTYDTILGPMNLFVSGGLLILVPMLVWLLMPAGDDVESEPIERFPDAVELEPPPLPPARSFAERAERSPLVTALLALPLLLSLARYYATHGVARLDPNAVNLTLLTAGLILHGSPRAYVDAVQRAVGGCAGVILQFPLYAGIMGLMKSSGLAQALATSAAGLGSGTAYAITTFFVAGLINLFVPSGGGQWAVQGPIAVEAARALGLPLGTAVMAVAYGDQWTNMLQPFWALPLLGITGVRARDIIGYTATIMLLSTLWFVLGLVLFT